MKGYLLGAFSARCVAANPDVASSFLTLLH